MLSRILNSLEKSTGFAELKKTHGEFMKKLLLILISTILSCILFYGCSSDTVSRESDEEETTQSGNDSSIVGIWSESIFDSGYIFESDGTGEDTFWELTFTYTADGGKLVIIYDSDTYGTVSYEYSVNGDILFMKRIAEDEETSTFEYERTG